MKATVFLSLVACSIESVEPNLPIDPTHADTGGTAPFLSIGHRGSPWSAPENTLPSFAAALREGANAIETDFCITQDGIAVIWHDRDPDDPVSLIRQSGAEGLPYIPWVPNLGNEFRRPVEQLTLSQLREHYDYAENEGVIGSTFGSGDRINAHIPTLDEFIDWSKTDEGKNLRALYVDVKVGDGQISLARTLAHELEVLTADVPYEILIASPHESVISAIRAYYRERGIEHRAKFLFDHEKAGVLAATRAGHYTGISMGKIVGRTWRSFLTEVDTVVAGAATDKIDPVLVWTVDDDARMLQLLDRGVDGIITNRAGDLARLVARGWDDHDRTIRAIRDCYAAHENDTRDAACATVSSLSLAAPLREDQLVDRACVAGDSKARDVFGCGGLFDAQNVRFDTSTASDTRIWWNADDEIVVVSR